MISPNRECSSFPIKIKIDKADVGLENVDNTADLDKPISNAVRDYLDGAKDSVSTNVALAKEYADNAKTSETNCEAIEAKIEALNVATVDTAQNITGAKTFAGETTITGPLGVSGDTALSGKVTVEKELNVDSNGIATLNGKVTASNTGNSLKVANHNTALTSNDVLSAKDINTPNGDGNNLVHRSGNESVYGIKTFNDIIQTHRIVQNTSDTFHYPFISELIANAFDQSDNDTMYGTFQLIFITDKNSKPIFALMCVVSSTEFNLFARGYNSDGSQTNIKLCSIPRS